MHLKSQTTPHKIVNLRRSVRKRYSQLLLNLKASSVVELGLNKHRTCSRTIQILGKNLKSNQTNCIVKEELCYKDP